jgi:hypothetical protein
LEVGGWGSGNRVGRTPVTALASVVAKAPALLTPTLSPAP